MIVVLSETSIGKKWVREELNAGFVKKIQEGTKLIPIRLDEVEGPEVLKATYWLTVEDTSDVGGVVDDVVAAVYGHFNRPPLGPQPGFTEMVGLRGHTKIDSTVLKGFGDQTVTAAHVSFVRTETVWTEIEALGINRESFLESLEVLRDGFLIEPTQESGVIPRSFKLTIDGFEEYLKAYFPEYDQVLRDVVVDLVNNKPETLDELRTRVSAPESVLRHVLDGFELQGLVDLGRVLGGGVHIFKVSRKLRRVLDGF